MAAFQYRLIDTAGGEIGIVEDTRARITEGESIAMPDGMPVPVVDVDDDEYGREGGVQATLAVEEG